jgi:predicted transcriptional regulator
MQRESGCKNMGSSRHGDRKTRYKIQSLRSLRDEMKAVARGSRPAPADAAKPSFDSVAAVIRLLTPENRRLLALIRDRKPQSVAEFVR